MNISLHVLFSKQHCQYFILVRKLSYLPATRIDSRHTGCGALTYTIDIASLYWGMLQVISEGWCRSDDEFLRELLISRHERRTSQLQQLNRAPLYPTEQVIWDEDIVPTAYYGGDGCLALPKLNLQFLTLHDYLLRNFNLFRLESTCKYLDVKYKILMVLA